MKNKFERDQHCPEHHIVDIGERWLSIKSQAQDSGIERVTAWLHQNDASILSARTHLCRGGHPALNPSEMEQDKEQLLQAQVEFQHTAAQAGESVLKLDYGLEGIDVYCEENMFYYSILRAGGHRRQL